MARRSEFHLYKQKITDPKTGKKVEVKNYSARKRHKGINHGVCLDTSDKAIARRRAQKWVDELKASNWGEIRPHLFREAGEKFARDHYREIKPKTAMRYTASLVHLIESFGDLTMAEITAGQLYEFEMGRKDEGVAAATIVNDLRCLSAIFGLAQLWEDAGVPWATNNPVPLYIKKRGKALKAEEQRTRHLSHEEEGWLLDVADSRWAMFIILAIETGMRREEQFSLLRSDINWNERYIQIRKEVAKSGSRRIPLTERGADVLRDLLASSQSMYVCPREGAGARYSPSSPAILDHLKSLCRKAGITDFRWHDLRRTYGCRCLQDRRMPLEAVSRCMGHSTVKVTEKAYAFLDLKHLKAWIDETEAKVVPITRRKTNNAADA